MTPSKLTQEKKFNEIVYLSSSTFFDRSANTVHVAKMTSAISHYGIPTTLYAYFDDNKVEISRVKEEYGVSNHVQIKNYEFIRSSFKLVNLFYLFIMSVIIGFRHNGNTLFYGRNLILLYLLKSLFKRVVVLELHSLETSRLRRTISRFLVKKFDLIVVITNALKNDLLGEYRFGTEKIIVLPDAADYIDIEFSTQSDNGIITVGYVGSFYQGRGIELILEVSKAFPEVNFILIGAPREYFIDKLNYENVKVCEYLPHNELKKYYVDFDIVIAPYSKKISVHGDEGDTSRWASPLKVFEYMSYSKCILISELPVFREVLADNYNCLFCEPDNPTDWIDKLRIVLNDPILRRRLGENAYLDFVNEYTWEIRVKKLVNYLHEHNITFLSK